MLLRGEKPSLKLRFPSLKIESLIPEEMGDARVFHKAGFFKTESFDPARPAVLLSYRRDVINPPFQDDLNPYVENTDPTSKCFIWIEQAKGSE